MPRVTNAAIAVVLIALMSPVVITWGDRTNVQRVFLCVMVAFFMLFVVLCLASALRPGSLGRFARRGRARRMARRSPSDDDAARMTTPPDDDAATG